MPTRRKPPAPPETPPRWVEYRRLSDIRANPDNAKEHETAGIAASVDRFGIIDLAAEDSRTGMLVAGHGRIKELRDRQAAGGERPDDVRVDADGEWLAPIICGWRSPDDDEAIAAGVGQNTWGPKGGWDLDALGVGLKRLQATDLGLAGVGYDEKDLNALVGRGTADRGERPGVDENVGAIADNYRNNGIRTLVLDYPLAEYNQVIALARDARARHNVEGNAELLVALLRRYDRDHSA